MARVNITVPDELIAGARAAKLNVSRVASAALAEELERLEKIAEMDRYLAELEVELGPIDPGKQRKAEAWLDEALGPDPASDELRRTA